MFTKLPPKTDGNQSDKNSKPNRWVQIFQASLFFENSFVPNDTIPKAASLPPGEKPTSITNNKTK